MTLKELRSRVRMEMGNLSKEDISDTEIDYHINEGQKLLCSDGTLLRDMTTFLTINDQERYPIISDTTGLQGILRVDYDDNKIEPVDYDSIYTLDAT